MGQQVINISSMEKRIRVRTKPKSSRKYLKQGSTEHRYDRSSVDVYRTQRSKHTEEFGYQRQMQKQYKKLQRDQMIEQNIKLKTMIFDLSAKLDEITKNEETSKQNQVQIQGEDSEIIKQKKKELRKQHIEFKELKYQISMLEKQVETVHNDRELLEKQDKLKFMMLQLEALREEKRGLKNVKKGQCLTLRGINNQGFTFEELIGKLRKQLADLKDQERSITQKLLQTQKTLLKNHQILVTKKSRIKDLKQKIKAKNKKQQNVDKSDYIVTPEMIIWLQEEIKELQQQKKQKNKNWQNKIAIVDNELREMKYEEEQKLILIKEQEKQLKFNQLKYKEIRKLVKQKIVNPQPEYQSDMSQYRHKRNIKHLEDLTNRY